VGCGVTKLYNILFSTFWLLFIQSFYPNDSSDDYKEAKIIYSNVMMVSVVFGVLLVPVCGKIADTCNPQYVLPIAFFSRTISISLFWFIVSPSGYYSYAVSVLLVLCTVMENVTVDCLLLRNADREIRGVIYGAATSCGYIG